MVESMVGQVLLDASLLVLVVASILEVAADVRDKPMPRFLSGRLGGLPSSHPATVLALLGIVGLLAGTAYEFVINALPGGRLIVGSVGIVAFLFAGGYIVGGNPEDGGYRG